MISYTIEGQSKKSLGWMSKSGLPTHSHATYFKIQTITEHQHYAGAEDVW